MFQDGSGWPVGSSPEKTSLNKLGRASDQRGSSRAWDCAGDELDEKASGAAAAPANRVLPLATNAGTTVHCGKGPSFCPGSGLAIGPQNFFTDQKEFRGSIRLPHPVGTSGLNDHLLITYQPLRTCCILEILAKEPSPSVRPKL